MFSEKNKEVIRQGKNLVVKEQIQTVTSDELEGELLATIANLQQMFQQYEANYDKLLLEERYDYDSVFRLVLVGIRKPTKEEKDEWKTAQQHVEETMKARRREEYERLKKEFE